MREVIVYIIALVVIGCTAETHKEPVEGAKPAAASSSMEHQDVVESAAESVSAPTWAELKAMTELIVSGPPKHLVFNESYSQGGMYEVIVDSQGTGGYFTTVRDADNTTLLNEAPLLASLGSQSAHPALVNVRVDADRVVWLFVVGRMFYVQMLSRENGPWELGSAYPLKDSDNPEVLNFLITTLGDPRRWLPQGRVFIPSVLRKHREHRVPVCVWAIEELREPRIIDICLASMLDVCDEVETLSHFEGTPILARDGLAEELERAKEHCARGRSKLREKRAQ